MPCPVGGQCFRKYRPWVTEKVLKLHVHEHSVHYVSRVQNYYTTSLSFLLSNFLFLLLFSFGTLANNWTLSPDTGLISTLMKKNLLRLSALKPVPRIMSAAFSRRHVRAQSIQVPSLGASVFCYFSKVTNTFKLVSTRFYRTWEEFHFLGRQHPGVQMGLRFNTLLVLSGKCRSITEVCMQLFRMWQALRSPEQVEAARRFAQQGEGVRMPVAGVR